METTNKQTEEEIINAIIKLLNGTNVESARNILRGTIKKIGEVTIIGV
jgi:hypothetical protein